MISARFAQHGTVFEIDLARQGRRVIERRFGSELSTDAHSFADERAATRAYHERIAELLETKWRRISRCEALDDVAPNPVLAAAAATGDPEALAVYTDWLLDHGDARGEMAALRTATPTAEVLARLAELERDHGVELFGLLAVLGPAWWAQFELEWRHGWIDGVTARHRFMTDGRAMTAGEAREALHHLLHAPVARFVSRLALDADFATAARQTLAHCPHVDSITTLALLVPGPRGDDLMTAFPSLRRMEVVGGLLGPGHPRIETLAITIRHDAFAELSGDWPALRHVELDLDTTERAPLASVAGVLKSRRLDRVTELSIASAQFVSPLLVESLVDSPILRHLERLVITAPLHPRARERLAAEAARHRISLRVGPPRS